MGQLYDVSLKSKNTIKTNITIIKKDSKLNLSLIQSTTSAGAYFQVIIFQ